MKTIEDNIIDLLLGSNSIPVKLRLKEDINSDYITLLQELDLLIEKYEGKMEIPKNLAYSFLDISNLFEFSERLYSEKELEIIENMKDCILEKIVKFYES
jgi:hypothetical protein